MRISAGSRGNYMMGSGSLCFFLSWARFIVSTCALWHLVSFYMGYRADAMRTVETLSYKKLKVLNCFSDFCDLQQS